MDELLPFYGLPVHSVQKRLEEALELNGVSLLSVKDGKISGRNEHAEVHKTRELIEPFAQYLPDLQSVAPTRFSYLFSLVADPAASPWTRRMNHVSSSTSPPGRSCSMQLCAAKVGEYGHQSWLARDTMS